MDSGSWAWLHPGSSLPRNKIHIWIIPTIKKNHTDYPQGFQLYLTSNETWHGVIRDQWQRFKPTQKVVKFGQKWDIRLRTVEWIFEDGVEHSTWCHTKLLQYNANCSFLCDMFSSSNLPTCQTYEEYACMYHQYWLWRLGRRDCLRHKMAKTFDPNYRLWDASTQHYTSYLRLSFESKETEIIEEIDVISLANLLGSIGGSLGMFFGFSISGYVICLLDKCLLKKPSE